MPLPFFPRRQRLSNLCRAPVPWLLLNLLLVLWLSPLLAFGPAHAQDASAHKASSSLRVLDTALRAHGAGARFPTAAPATTVSLPDEWAYTRGGQGGPAWYRVELPRVGSPDDEGLYALFIEHVCSNLEVYVNGERAHSGGRMNAPYTNNCNYPQLVSLPSAMLNRDRNTLDIKVVGHPLDEVGSRQRAGALSALVVGPQSELAAYHARLTALQVIAPQAVGATLLLMGGFMFVLGFMNRRESHLAYFGALSVGWALVDMRLWLRDMPLGHSEIEFLVCAMLGFITWAAVQFLLRYAGMRYRVVDVLLPLQCALLAVTLVVAGKQHLYTVSSVWYGVLALEVMAASAWHLHHQHQRRHVRSVCRHHRIRRAVDRHTPTGRACGATGDASGVRAGGSASRAAAGPRTEPCRAGQGSARATGARSHGRNRTQLPPDGRVARGAGDRA